MAGNNKSPTISTMFFSTIFAFALLPLHQRFFSAAEPQKFFSMDTDQRIDCLPRSSKSFLGGFGTIYSILVHILLKAMRQIALKLDAFGMDILTKLAIKCHPSLILHNI